MPLKFDHWSVRADGQCAACLVAHLAIRVRMHHRREASNNRLCEFTRPCGLARSTAQGMRRIAANAGHRIVQHRDDGVDCPAIRAVIEELDAPPAHLRILVRQAVDQRLKRRLADSHRAEFAGVHAADQRAHRFDASRRDCERLHPLSFLAHAEHGTSPTRSETSEFRRTTSAIQPSSRARSSPSAPWSTRGEADRRVLARAIARIAPETRRGR